MNDNREENNNNNSDDDEIAIDYDTSFNSNDTSSSAVDSLSTSFSGMVSCWSSSPDTRRRSNNLATLNESEDYEDSDDEGDALNLLLPLVMLGRLRDLDIQDTPTYRNVRVQYTRISWSSHWEQYRNDPDFERAIRMKRESFVRLVDILRFDLEVDSDMADLRGGQVSPEMCVYMTLRYLAGAPDIDVKTFISVSGTTFYHCLHKTLRAICRCEALAIRFPKTKAECEKLATDFCLCTRKRSIRNCVGAVDGYLLSINAPSDTEARNQRSFFSGHYQRTGVNVQAVCDSNKMFLYFAVTGPGSMNDRAAMRENIPFQGSLYDLTETLPEDFVVIADAAYEPTEHVVPMFYGVHRNDVRLDNFNYAASCCRIRIEQAFGYMTNKWRILHRPLCQNLKNVKLVAIAIARLHNFCIREKLVSDSLGDDQNYDFVPNSNNNVPYYTTVPDMYDGMEEVVHPMPNEDDPPNLYRVAGSSNVRNSMVTTVNDAGEVRPTTSPLYRRTLNTLVVRRES